VHRHNERTGRLLTQAEIGVRCAGVEVDGVTGFQPGVILALAQFKRALQNIKELIARMHVRARGVGLLRFSRDGEELCEVRVHVAVGNHVTQALEVIRRMVCAGLRHARALFAAVNAEEWLRLIFKEIRQVFGEDHRDAREIAQRGNDAPRLKLRQKAGGEAGLAAQLDEAHGFSEPQALDALADVFVGDEVLCGFFVDLRYARVDGCGAGFRRGHRSPPQSCTPGFVSRMKIYFYATVSARRRQIRPTRQAPEPGVERFLMQGRVLFSGASGMLGTALRRALASSFQTLQLVRRQPVTNTEVEWHPEALQAFTQTDSLENLTAAIHLSGANVAGQRWTAAYKRELVESRVRSTRALAEALAGLRQLPRVLLVASGTGIYGNRGDEVLDESSAVGAGFLADLCHAWEEAARPAKEAGIRVVHLRCGVVLGGGAGALEKMLPIFRLGLGGKLGSGRQWMSWVALADVIRAVLFLLEQETLADAINIVAPNPVTNAEFARALGRAVHRPAAFPAPAFALRVAFGEMADKALLASQRAVPKRLLDAGFVFQHPTIDDALRAALQ
jgi:uncharacterized protein